MEKKKVCFVVASPFTAIAFLNKHFEYLSENYELYLVANFDGEKKYKFDSKYVKECKSINIKRSISIIDDLNAVLKLKTYFEQNKFDAVHGITPKAGLVSMLASKLAKIKVRIYIFTGQVWHTKHGVFKFILMSIDKFIVYCATDILVDGEPQKNFLIKNNILSDEEAQVLGKGSISGVDTNKFIPDEALSEKYRMKLDIKNEVVFLFLGRLNHDKGILDLVHAFVKLNTLYSNTKLVLVGPDEENMMIKVKDITTNENVVLYGSTDKPQEVLQMADVFCLPSYREAFGLSVIEASSLEKPVICSDTYGLMETIIEGETGLRHEVANVNSIFEQMKKMMDANLRVTLGKNGRKYVLANFSADIISEKWFEYYRTKLT